MNKRKMLFTLLAIQFFVMFALQCLVGFNSDDYVYMNGTSFINILQSEYNQYMNWSGRSVAHLFVRLSLTLPKVIFNIINSGVYVGFTYLIYLHANTTNKTRCDLYLITSSLCWLLLPKMGETVFWVTGSCNYLWGSFIILLTLLPFRLNLFEQLKETKKTVFYIAIAILSIMAGWYNENTSGGFILMILLFIGYYIYKKIPVKPWMFLSLACGCVGFLFMYFAPGNDVRILAIDNGAMPLFSRLHILCEYVDDNWQLYLCLFAGFYLYYIFSEKVTFSKIVLPISYVLVAFAVLFALVLSPWITKRAYFGASAFFIISLVSVVSLCDVKLPLPRALAIFTLSFTIISFAFSFAIESVHILQTYKDFKVQESIIKTAALNNEAQAIVPYAPLYSDYCTPLSLRSDPENWRNKLLSEYYGVESIVESHEVE